MVSILLRDCKKIKGKVICESKIPINIYKVHFEAKKNQHVLESNNRLANYLN